jgi:hypothetical protein
MMHEQPGGKPSQSAGYDDMSLGGADWIAIDAVGADLGSPAPLNGVVGSDPDWRTGWHEGRPELFRLNSSRLRKPPKICDKTFF